jgi:hypothetical protein
MRLTNDFGNSFFETTSPLTDCAAGTTPDWLANPSVALLLFTFPLVEKSLTPGIAGRWKGVPS